ncbi:MAG: mechanosensitive ion channel [Myxococcales bacterium]|nr:mechanosensitive ion channel [Myxococcales bacterium]
MANVTAWLKSFGATLDRALFKIGDTTITPLSLLIFLGTLIIAAVVGRLVRQAIGRYFTRRTDVSEGAGYALERIAQLSIVAAGVLVGLENVGIDLSALTALGAVLGVGIGFGLQGVAQNWVSGLTLLIERPVQRGDFIELGDTVGVVDEITLRATRVLTRDNVAIIVPNHALVTGTVHNLSQPNRNYRLRIPVGVAYGSNTALVTDTLVAVAKANDEIRHDPAPQVLFVDFGDSALAFELCVWLDDPRNEPRIASDLRFAIDHAFRENEIQIPFPQRDVHLKQPS